MVNNKHRKALDAIFKKPVSPNIRWKDIEALFIHLGAEVVEGRGSRVCFILNKRKIVFHRPHPTPYAEKAVVTMARKFLEDSGVYYAEV